MTETFLLIALATFLCIVALGLGFVAIVLRGGSWRLRLEGLGFGVESHVDTDENKEGGENEEEYERGEDEAA